MAGRGGCEAYWICIRNAGWGAARARLTQGGGWEVPVPGLGCFPWCRACLSVLGPKAACSAEFCASWFLIKTVGFSLPRGSPYIWRAAIILEKITARLPFQDKPGDGSFWENQGLSGIYMERIHRVHYMPHAGSFCANSGSHQGARAEPRRNSWSILN